MNTSKPPVLGMILKGYPRISETFISNEILLLERLGFHIHLFSMRHPRENFTHQSINQISADVDYLPATILADLPRLMFYNLCLFARKPKIYARALKTAWRRFQRTHKSATIKHLLQAGYIVQHLLPKNQVNHLHAHFAHSPASVAMFAGQLSGLPFSFTAHAKDIYTSHPGQLKEKIALARFVVTCTEYNRRHLMKISDGGKTSIHRIYHGIDTGLFANQKEPNSVVTPPYQILTIARMTPKKGLPTVLRALKLLIRKGIAVKHTLIGDGDDRDKILALIKDLALEDVTHWIGTQPHEVVLEHYLRADLFVLGCEVAANGDRDGIPNVLLESMAMGVPVVATTVSAIPELVENEKTGLLVQPAKPDLLADAISRLLTDKELRRRVIPAARECIIRKFDNKALVGDLARIHAKALGMPY